MAGVKRIEFSEIDAWARLTGETPKPWEVRLLRRMDDVITAKITENAERAASIPPGHVDMRDGKAVAAAMSTARARANAFHTGK